MSRLLTTLAITSLITLGSTAAIAVSPSQQECEAAGGTFEGQGGTKQCVTNVGNSENSQTATTSGQGNLNNKTQCNGPGNSQTHCLD
jgi:hypothetical protein